MQFHSPDYINFLASVTPAAVDALVASGGKACAKLQRFNISDDCPVFDGMFSFCQLYSGASLQARRLPSLVHSVLSPSVLSGICGGCIFVPIDGIFSFCQLYWGGASAGV